MSQAGLYRMFVRDLVLVAQVGVHAHEKRGPQRIAINAELGVREPDAPFPDSLSSVLSYETVVAAIRETVEAGHINLIETLAERIAIVCLSDERVASARVRVEKLDVFAQAAGVGVEIERKRS